jgi:hypothetical protein
MNALLSHFADQPDHRPAVSMPMLGLAESRRREPDIQRTPMHDQPAHRGPAGLRVTPRKCYHCLDRLALT